jgi:putative acetyltransferase
LSTFVIRLFAPGDGEALAYLHRRAILATPDDHYTLAERESWASGLDPKFYGSEADGSVLEVAVRRDDWPIAFCHNVNDEILGLYVDPDWQGRGTGSALLQRAEAMMATRGHDVSKVIATTSARAFYERHGYRFVADHPHKTRGGLVLPAVDMAKTIVTSR